MEIKIFRFHVPPKTIHHFLISRNKTTWLLWALLSLWSLRLRCYEWFSYVLFPLITIYSSYLSQSYFFPCLFPYALTKMINSPELQPSSYTEPS